MTIRFADTNDIPLIRALAEKIWPNTYRELLSPDQIEYMMQWIYSPTSLENQITEKKHQFLIVEEEDQPIGFASYSAADEAGVYKLHKLYVMTAEQGKGLGKIIINFIVKKLQQVGAHAIQLNVKRDNKAKYFYEKLGFEIIEEVDIDIGNNYFMRDYIMEKRL